MYGLQFRVGVRDAIKKRARVKMIKRRLNTLRIETLTLCESNELGGLKGTKTRWDTEYWEALWGWGDACMLRGYYGIHILSLEYKQ